MREIKFRAWIKEEEIMTYFEDESYILNGDMSVDAFTYEKSDCKNYFEPCYKTINAELMQFTGLHDKNGKEIYEGDKVYIIPEDNYGEIKWDSDMARFVVIYDDLITDFDNWYGYDLEVGGTIYD